MKKILLLPLLFLSLFCSSQDLSYGGRVGANLSSFRYTQKLKWDENNLHKPILSYGINGVITRQNNKIGISVCPGIIQKGTRYNNGVTKYKSKI